VAIKSAAFSTNNPADLRLANSELASKRELKFAVLDSATSNLFNLRIRQLHASVPLAMLRSSVSNFICKVFGMSCPTKIRESIIRLVAVVVAGLHTVRAGSDERGEYQSVNVPVDVLAVSTERNAVISCRVRPVFKLDPFPVDGSIFVSRIDSTRPYASVVANSVSGKPVNITITNRII
jgi:putative lipoic acid-binding regulatory protein